MTNLKQIAAGLAAALALVAPASAFTEPKSGPQIAETGQLVLGSVVPTAKINASGFDLTTEKGVAMLHRRIASAANQLCSGYLHVVNPDIAAFRGCVGRTVQRSVLATADHSLVTFHYALSEPKRSYIFKAVPHGWTPS